MDIPLIYVDNSDTKSGDEADAKCSNHTANSDTHAIAIDGRKHLAGNDASNDRPTYLHDEVEDTGNLRRPVAHEISTDDLLENPFQ